MSFDSERYVFIGDYEIDTEPCTSSVDGKPFLLIHYFNKVYPYYLHDGLARELSTVERSEEISNFCRDILLMEGL